MAVVICHLPPTTTSTTSTPHSSSRGTTNNHITDIENVVGNIIFQLLQSIYSITADF